MLTYASVATYVRRGRFLCATRIHWLLLWFVGDKLLRVQCPTRVSGPPRLLNFSVPPCRVTGNRNPVVHALLPCCGTHVNCVWPTVQKSHPVIRLATTDLNVNGSVC
ncbi:hypothetical protein MRB53_001312 [Persea americana]|uniref:Uncharacterized protein n=1 Tax=Persea americana TaxID=3435 RepID=A0ACC2MRH5_PERAE|nr:hypothetical protein MRB53_001312 [Persea americana]